MYSCIIHKVSLQSFLPAVKNSHTLWHPETLPSTGWGYWVVLLGHMAFDPSRKWAQSTRVSHVDTSSDPSDDFSTLENPILCQNRSMQWTNKAANKWGIWSILLKLSEWASAPLFFYGGLSSNRERGSLLILLGSWRHRAKREVCAVKKGKKGKGVFLKIRTENKRWSNKVKQRGGEKKLGLVSSKQKCNRHEKKIGIGKGNTEARRWKQKGNWKKNKKQAV